MDSNNWRQPSQTEQPPTDGAGGDWRSQLQDDSRNRIVNKIMDTLKRHLPSSGHEGVQELRKIAMRFEEKIYHAATSQSDYLRRISLKMLTMESKSNAPGPMPNAMPSNSSGMSRNPQDPASQSMQPQVQNQGQLLSNPMASNQPTVQGRPQIMNPNIQINISSAGVQSSASLPSALPSVNGLAKNNMPNVIQNSNMQNMSGISQNSMGNSMVQGVASNNYSNSQKQMQGRQNMQQVGSQQQIQQPQNQQQYLYQQQQLQQQQLLKQKLHQSGIHQPLLQPHMQQQTQQNNLLPSAQLQSSQQSVMQNSSVMQPSMVSGLPQNQPSSIQQSSQSAHQQQQQSVLRQQQQQQQAQQAPVHHQQTQMSQQSMLQSQQQQQQHLMGQQQLGQQTSMPDIQQQQQPQRMMSQQNNLSSMSGQQQSNQNLQQQQIMGQQSNLPSMHQQQLNSQTHVGTLPQQQQLLGNQSGNSSMLTNQHPAHMLQQSKVLVQQQNPNGSALLSGGGQQQPQQQQMMPQMQSQTAQLQQQLGLQQQSNSLQHNMQQRLQTSNGLLQQQNVIDPQKMFQSQRTPTEAPSTSLDSTAQTGNSEQQEEVYQKIKVMKDLYFPEVHDIYQKICAKLKQHESLSQQANLEGVERLKIFKQMLERILHCLQITKSGAQHFHKDKLPTLEKQILSVLSSHRPRKPGPPLQQGQIPQSHMQSLQQNQQSHLQIPQTQSHESGVNPQVQSVNVQGSSVPTMQPGDMSGLHGTVSSLSGITSSQPNMMNSLQPGSNLDSGQGNAPSSIQQVAVASIQQNPVNAPQQATPQTGVNLLHSSMNSLQPNSNMLQSQHLKQQQEQQLKQQFQHRHIQQQLLHKQQLLQQQQQQQQQQQLHIQQLKQQPGQMQGHQMQQLHQLNDVNDIKLRQSMGLKPGLLPQHLSQAQRYQQLKPGVSFPNSSPQMLQAGSPQINQHSSPQIDQQNLLPPLTKVGTPLQSANSPFVPSMSPLAPSPMPGDPEKPNSATSNAANIIQHIAPASASSLAIGTPGISASPLLAESSPPDVHGATLNTFSGKSGATDQPLERLLKVVKSMSSKALNASVDDIVSVVSMIDRIAGSAPGNGSRAAVGEDLVAMTKCRLQARNFITQDGSSGMKRMRRYTSAMPLNVASSVGSPNNSFKQLTGAETSDLESTATSVKRPRIEVNPAILEEVKEINEHLIDTVVDISDEDVDPTLSAVAAEGGEGTIVKCTFTAVSLSPNLKSQYCSAQMSPIQPLRLLVPANYPNCSPILLDKFPVEVSKEYDDLSVKVKSRFSISLRALSQPMSLREIARTWDDCARWVITEYAQLSGGGTFSSKYGSWENCLTAT